MKTFEEAAFAAAVYIGFPAHFPPSKPDVASLTQWHQILEEEVRYDPYGSETDISWAYANLARTAAAFGREYPNHRKASDWVVTLCAKQRDYGPQNILKFGHHGLVVRIWDKIARVENLTASGREAANEPLADSLWDIIGYCMIGIMLCEGTFELPLEEVCG